MWNMNKKTDVTKLLNSHEVNEEKYQYMLEVLPPEAMNCNSFLVGEPADTNEKGFFLYDMYFRIGDVFFYAGLKTLSEFNALEIDKDAPEPKSRKEIEAEALKSKSLYQAIQEGDEAAQKEINDKMEAGEIVRIF